MMNKIKVSYQKELSEDGIVYEQKVKISKSLLTQINKEIATAKENERHEVFFNIYDYIYLSELNEGINFTTLTTAKLVRNFLTKTGTETKRFKLDRNTIIEFI